MNSHHATARFRKQNGTPVTRIPPHLSLPSSRMIRPAGIDPQTPLRKVLRRSISQGSVSHAQLGTGRTLFLSLFSNLGLCKALATPQPKLCGAESARAYALRCRVAWAGHVTIDRETLQKGYQGSRPGGRQSDTAGSEERLRRVISLVPEEEPRTGREGRGLRIAREEAFVPVIYRGMLGSGGETRMAVESQGAMHNNDGFFQIHDSAASCTVKVALRIRVVDRRLFSPHGRCRRPWLQRVRRPRGLRGLSPDRNRAERESPQIHPVAAAAHAVTPATSKTPAGRARRVVAADDRFA